MGDQVPVQVAKERNRTLRELAAKKNLEFRRSFVGRELPAITLSNGEALTDNYLKLELESKHEPNQWLHVKTTAATSDGLAGHALY